MAALYRVVQTFVQPLLSEADRQNRTSGMETNVIQ